MLKDRTEKSECYSDFGARNDVLSSNKFRNKKNMENIARAAGQN